MRFLLACTALCAGCVVETEVKSVCATRHDVAVAGALPGEPRSLALATEVALSEDELETLETFDPGLRFRSVRLHATSGIDDLDFVDAAEITASTPALPTVVVGACDGDCAEGQDLVVSARAVDALDYLAAGTITLGGSLRGDLPTTAWTMDVEICAGE